MLNPRASLGAVILGADCAGSRQADRAATTTNAAVRRRSEEHTSELQSLRHLVCRLLLDTPNTEIYTLSLHDALPILGAVILGADCAGSRQADRAATTTNAAVRRDVIGVSVYCFSPSRVSACLR